ncbi:MAG: 1-deoxy-D-xylulose-5-phosphate synthase [bacterium]|nr:1-deoxy-D-xylulose-5-phosphate synthase [bacterium]
MFKQLTLAQLQTLATNLRQEILATCERNGGHLSGSLGTVELTLALHQVFEPEKDRFIFDVGHQSYTHKLLTDRPAAFATLRQKNGLSGFMNPGESKCDPCVTGHAGNSISLALGLSYKDKKHCCIAIIGDGSLLNGMAVEALNHLATTKQNILVIVNDNQYSIDKCAGAIADGQRYQQFLQSFGLPYTGPIDGHNLPLLIETLQKLQSQSGPRVLHIKTQKGHGCDLASQNPVASHFYPAAKSRQQNRAKLHDFVGQALVSLGEKDERVQVISAAMQQSAGLMPFVQKFPERFFDVGIAESHALGLSAGLALAGKKPFCHFYASFLQRAFDQIIHDVAIGEVPVALLVDRAGLVGEDGATHQGTLAFSFLNLIPNLQILMPGDLPELQQSLELARVAKKPVAICYPKLCFPPGEKFALPLPGGKLTPRQFRYSQSQQLAVITTGFCKGTVEAIENPDLDFAHFHLPIVKPLPEKFLEQIFANYKKVLVVEENALIGGVGQQIATLLANRPAKNRPQLLIQAIPDEFIAQASRSEQLKTLGLDQESLEKIIRSQTSAVCA